MSPLATVGSVDEFRAGARQWLADNMPRIDPGNPPIVHRGDEACWVRARELQKRLYKAGFAGICFPREYGGQGLDYEYQTAFNAETAGYEMPLILNIPCLSICCATLLDMGSPRQKRQHISAALRGEELLVQMLSEPNCGSDLAGVTTRAERRGDRWIINGAKTWTTGAFAADYGLCLARTNWAVPKHEGLTMFLVPIKHPGITIRPIKQISGSAEFCEEFLDNVDVDDTAVVGEVNQGWQVASRQLYHERRTMGNGSEFSSGLGAGGAEEAPIDFFSVATKSGRANDARVREMVGRALVYRAVNDELSGHVFRGVRDGTLPPAAGSLIRLFAADTHNVEIDTALSIAATHAAVGRDPELLEIGIRYLERQVISIGGGTTEIARNVIAERVLNLPREYAADRGVPFNEVRRHREQPQRK